MNAFLLHDESDTVGVAVRDVSSGETVKGQALQGNADPELKALSDIPLGHKIALIDFKEGDTVTKYGQDIGKIIKPVKKGEHVHTHNLKTKRW